MKEIFEALIKEGFDYETTLERFGGDEDFYLEMLSSFTEKDPLQDLKEAMKDRDYARCFRAAHTLKGVMLNLGLDELSKPCIRMRELYRSGKNEEADSLIDEADRTITEFTTWVNPLLEKWRKEK